MNIDVGVERISRAITQEELGRPITQDERSYHIRRDVRTEMLGVKRRPRAEILADPKIPSSMKQVMRCNLDEAEAELISRAHRAGYDNMNNRQVINALSDNVIVTGKDGDSVVINNWENIAAIRKWEQQKNKATQATNPQVTQTTTTDEVIEWDD